MMYTVEVLTMMFATIVATDYATLGELAKALGVSYTGLNTIIKKLEFYGMTKELQKIAIIKENSYSDKKNRFNRLRFAFKAAISFILNDCSELDYLLKYTWRTKKEFHSLAAKTGLNLSNEEYLKVIGFFSNLEDMQLNHNKYRGLTKAMITEGKLTIRGYEVTPEDNNLAMSYLTQTKMRWNNKLYRQALDKILKEKGVKG